MKDEEDPLDPEIMRSLKSERPVPKKLEQEVLQTLREHELIQTNRRTNSRWFWKFSAAAILMLSLFGVGFWTGQTSRSAPANQKLFALFLYQPLEGIQNPSDHTQEYGQWIRSVRNDGRFASGEKLKSNGRTLRMNNGKLKIDLSPLRNSNQLAGYFLIQARTYEEALRIASECPHLKYGGVIEVREIEAT